MDTNTIKIYQESIDLSIPCTNSAYGELSWSPDGTRLLYYGRLNEVLLVEAEGRYAGYILDLVKNQIDGKTSYCKLYQDPERHSLTNKVRYLSNLDNTYRLKVQIGRNVPVSDSWNSELITPIEEEPNHFLTSIYRYFIWSPCQEWAITQYQSGPCRNENNKRWQLVHINGVERHLLPEGHPISWSPTETIFAYFTQGSVYLISPNAVNTPRKIIEDGYTAIWHPKGTSLLFERENSLYVTDLQGHVSHIGKHLDASPIGFYGMRQANYSPDGQQITFLTDCPTAKHDQIERIYAIRPDGGDLQLLAEGTRYSWSYDSQWIFYNKTAHHRFRKPTNELMQMSRYGQAHKRIADGYNSAASPRARKLAFCNEDAIWVMGY